MIQKIYLQTTFCLTVLVALAAIYFISPVALALNSFSIDLERDSTQFLSAADSLSLSVTGDFTAEAWVKPETAVGTDEHRVIMSKDNDQQRSWTLEIDNPSGNGERIYLFLFSDADGNPYSELAWNTSVGSGNWHHIAVSVSPSNASTSKAKLYIDGIDQGTPDQYGEGEGGASSIADTTAPFRVGLYDQNGPIGPFDGLIDEVRLWNVARTQSQIQFSFQNELTGSESNLVGYWSLNNTLVDLSGDSNDLVANNGPVYSSDVPFIGSPPSPPAQVRKSADETTTNSAALQNDDELKVGMLSGRTYSIEGAVFVSATNANPDIRIAFTSPAGSQISIGHMSAAGSQVDGGLLETSGSSSARIQVPANTGMPIMIKGTIVAGADGELQLQWGQFAANANAVTVKKGSYLRIQQI